jgi:UDP:flavonoid glycosyltransferase YjiC (YdhE family)
MRALFTSHPAIGHFLPLTPVARAMAEAGHDVLFGTPVFLRPAVEAAGFRWVLAGVENDDPEMAPVRARMFELRGAEQRRYSGAHVFGGVRPRRLVPDILALAESWRPDLIVHDSAECGAMIAAELLGIPHATVEVHPTAVSVFTSMVDEPLQTVRATFGLPPRSIQGLLDEYLTLVPFPPSLTPVGAPTAPVTRHFRGLPPDDRTIDLPDWLDRVGPRPLVYVSLGTVSRRERFSETFSKLLAGLQDADVEVVATVGHDFDPASLGPRPEQIHLERFLPLGALLPRCSLVVFHGGSGTLGHAIANGLPMVILPLGADQPENAARCAELGASRTLDQDNLTPEYVRDVVLDVLHTPSYRQTAERLRDEFDRLPGPEYAVELLERLSREKRPIPAAR